MNIIVSIVPIFIVIFLGWIFHRKGFIPPEFIGPANRLVYYLAIPAMVFNALYKASFRTHFNPAVIAISMFVLIFGFGVAWALGKALGLKRGALGSYTQTGFHGNMGYIGLAVSYYYLGEAGFVKAGIIISFLMILQNLLSVVALTYNSWDESESRSKTKILGKILGNPVIASSLAGILFSLAKIPLPPVFARSLDILSGLALPLALLIIGATLSFELIFKHMGAILSAVAIKLILLPGLGLGLFAAFGIRPGEYLPALILLATPTATVTYIMAKEMKGEPAFNVGVISAGTLLSALTYSIWLTIVG